MLNFRSLFYRPQSSKEKVVWSNDLIDDVEFVYSVEEDCYLLVHFKDNTLQRLDLKPEEKNWEMDGIVIPDYEGTWYVIDCVVQDGDIYYLLEHEKYGDETACLIVDNKNIVIDDEVYDDWLSHLEDALTIPQC